MLPGKTKMLRHKQLGKTNSFWTQAGYNSLPICGPCRELREAQAQMTVSVRNVRTHRLDVRKIHKRMEAE